MSYYKAEVRFFKHGEKDEYEYDCSTLVAAVEWINRQVAGSGDLAAAWINGRKVRLRGCHVVGKDNEPFCINQGWHDLYAEYDYPQIKPLKPIEVFMARVPTREELAEVLRPVPTNPRTAFRVGDAVQFRD